MRAFSKLYGFSASAIALVYRLLSLSITVFLFFLIYRVLLEQFFDGSKQIIPLLIFWLFSAYVVLPRTHRILTKYYLPNYYVGRIRSPAGFLSDPINIALFGERKDIHNAMIAAGWQKADELTLKSFFKTIYAIILRKSYPTAPVGNMYLFSRKQDFAYEKEVNGSPAERHHIRFWKTAKKWRLPGGHDAEWLAAATYDTSIGIKLATGQIDHFINENIDTERDYTIRTLEKTGLVERIEKVKHFSDAYHDRNNGGDRIKTDGTMPFLYIKTK